MTRDERGGSRLCGERLVAAIWDRPGRWLAASLLVTILALSQIRGLSVDNSVEIWFADGDPALSEYRAFQGLFGGEESVAVVLHDPDGMAGAAGLARLDRVSAVLADVDGVARVESLATQDHALGSAGSRHATGASGGPPSRLINRDGTTAAVLAFLSSDDEWRRDRILADMRAALAKADVDYRMAGIGVVYSVLNALSADNTARLFAASSAVTLLLLWLVLGRLAPACLCLAVVGVATVWTLGAFGAAGRSLNMVTMVLPTLITVIGVANCIHVLRHVARSQGRAGRRERVVRGVGDMIRPCGFVTATTAAGFAALTLSPMPVLADFGAFAALGMVTVFLLTVVCCTIALRWPRMEANPATASLLGACVERLVQACMRRRVPVLASAGSVMISAVAAITQLTVDTHTIGFLPFEHPLRQDYRFIERNFGPATPLEFVVRAEPGVALDGVVEAVAAWQARVRSTGGAGWSYSLADWVRQTGGGDLPPPATLQAGGALRVTFAIPMVSAGEIGRHVDRLMAAARMPPGVRVSPSGYLPLYVRMMDRIVSSQVRGFALALVAVLAAVSVLFRSLRLTAAAAAANLLPVGIVLGTMSVAGIPLDVATVTLGAIVLGIAVDDTIFYLDGFQRARSRGLDDASATVAAACDAGTSMALTTLVLAGGFLVCTLADVKSVVLFGLLLAVAMSAALLADLVVLPALLGAARRRSNPEEEGAPDAAGAGADA